MELREYQLQAKRTCPTIGDIKLDLSHMVLGMNSELSELSDAIEKDDIVNQSEELADIAWYVANYCTFRNIDLSSLVDKINSTDLAYCIQELTDKVKKFIAYDKPIGRQDEIILLCNIVTLLSVQCPITLKRALDNNINKLKIRYPEKFTVENALNRDLDSERKELEK